MARPTPGVRFQAEDVWLPFSESLFEWDDRFHDLMLNDRIRIEAYHEAIRRTVKPGMTVVDLGTGTGILAQWAIESGAQRVYGIEMSRDILDLATRRMNKAGLSDRFVPIYDLSFNVELPQRVNVLISEIIGNLADNENFVPILADATKRFLTPGGAQIPQQVVSHLVPVEAVNAHSQITSGRWNTFDSKSISNGATNEKLNPFDLYYDVILPFSGYLSDPQQLLRFDGSWKQDPSYTVRRVFQIQQRGLLTGFKGYFVSKLADGVMLDISGDDVNQRTSSDSWKHAYLPIEVPIGVRAGDVVEINFSRSMVADDRGWGRQAYAWMGHVNRQGLRVGSFGQSTAQGRLVQG